MSPWLLKRFSRKTLFFSELLIVSTIVHCIIGLALFVLYRGQYESFSFEVHSACNPDQPVLFLHHRGPLHSTRSGVGHKVHMHHARSSIKSIASKAVNKLSYNNPAMQKKRAVAHAVNSKSIAEKTATMFVDKVKKAKRVPSQKNKKLETRHMNVVAENLPKTPLPAQPEEKKEIVEQVVQPNEVIVKKDATHEAVHENITHDASAENSKEALINHEGAGSQELLASEPFDIAVGSDAIGEHEGNDQEFPGLSPEAARIYYAVQEEITTLWKPPMGLAKDLVCTISVRLDREGKIANLAVKKTSGVLIYDLAASQAAQDMKLPQIAWGKEFSIAFKL